MQSGAAPSRDFKLAEEFYTLSGAHKLYGTGTGNHWSSTLSTQTVMWSNFLALNFNLIVNWKVAAAEIHIKEHYSYFDVTKAYTTLLALSPVSCPSEILYNFGNVPEMIFAHYLQKAFSKWSWTQWNTDRKRQQDNDLKVSKQQSYRAGPGRVSKGGLGRYHPVIELADTIFN